MSIKISQATSDPLFKKYQKIEEIDSLLGQEYYDQDILLSGKQKMLSEAIKGYVNGL